MGSARSTTIAGGASTVPVAAALPAFAVPVAVGDANAAGAAATIVRSDHVHQRSRTDSAVIVVAASNSLAPTLADLAYRCDGVADQVQINAAIAAVAAVGGMVVLLDGTFNVADNLSITLSSNVSLLGQGRGTLIINTTANFDLIYGNGVTGVLLGQLRLQGRQANAAFCCIGLDDATYCTIFSVWTVDSGIGIALGSPLNVFGCDHCIIFGCYVTGSRCAGAGGIDLTAINANRNNRNLIVACHCWSNNSFNIVFGDYAVYCAIVDCELYSAVLSGGAAYGIGLAGASDNDNIIVGNVVYENPYAGIQCSVGNENLIVGNHVYHNERNGIEITGSTQFGYLISSNHVSSNNRHGISVAGTDHVIVGNLCKDNDRSNTVTYDGIFINASYCVIVGNRCKDNDRYEINISADTCVRNKVFHNGLYGTDHLLPFNDLGTGTELPTIQFQFQQGGTEAGGIQLAQFIHATASAKGWEIDADTEWAIALGQLPSELIQVVRIRIWAVGLAAPGALDRMRLEIAINAGQSDEAYTAEPIAVANKSSNEANFAINDVISWILTSGDDVDIGHLDAGDDLEVKVLHEIAGNGHIATDAVFRCVEIQYV